MYTYSFTMYAVWKKTLKCALLFALAIALLAGLCGCGAENSSGKKINLVFACNASISYEDKEKFQMELDSLMADEGVTVGVDWLLFDPELDSQEYSKLTLNLALDTYTVYILSDQEQSIPGGVLPGLSTTFSEKEWFRDLTQYGIEEDSVMPGRALLKDSTLFNDMGFNDIDFYIHLSNHDYAEVELDSSVTLVKKLIK